MRYRSKVGNTSKCTIFYSSLVIIVRTTHKTDGLRYFGKENFPPFLSSFYGLGVSHCYKWKIPFKRNLAKQNPCPCRKIQRQGLQIRSRMRTACVCGDFLCRQGSILYRKSQLQNAPLCLFPTLLYAYPIASIRLQCLPIVKCCVCDRAHYSYCLHHQT